MPRDFLLSKADPRLPTGCTLEEAFGHDQLLPSQLRSPANQRFGTTLREPELASVEAIERGPELSIGWMYLSNSTLDGLPRKSNA